ncbi:flavin reductase family protein [Conexibacter stalactiti]|uniref:Flavin reductase family protein n=1 Tax=Conexibacter stalactiti TaxID=1940611 RepID=A0ABU4HXS4_9ACTN|nr:flavin reductase family protein [Conexibacter stalactiti]MDW5598126.1 flavin reductase family protein [Conexibacter stalactiti]MEC5038768.1 flavin reductase family protein [Conexibacter stalactiti]
MSVDPTAFRSAMKQLASGLVVVTTQVDGRPWGMTVTACCAVSAEPPLVLVSLHGRTRSRAAIRDHGRFGLNVLGADQKHVAELAARPGAPKWLDDHCVRHPADAADAGRPPRVSGALVALDCRVREEFDVGDHTLVVGDVLGTTSSDRGEHPLVYFDRAYRRIGEAL